MLPPDGHVHTQWSADAVRRGSMEWSCARAVELGLPSVAFTEHVDFTRWVIDPQVLPQMDPDDAALVDAEGRLLPPPLDVGGYMACVQECRDRFPGLRILTGAELGEPHWHASQVAAVLAAARPDRVLGSVHTLELAGGLRMVDHLFGRLEPHDLMAAYFDELLKLVESGVPFGVLAHIDYPLRYWPAGAAPFDVADFEDQYRTVLAALARSGRALEVNTRVPLPAQIVIWWRQAGGQALAFGSDAHQPGHVASRFVEAAAMAEAAGFRPGCYPHDYWRRNA